MEEKFICPKCGNDDAKFIGELNGKKYCRLCILTKGKEATQTRRKSGAVVFKLGYNLSQEQQIISNQIIQNYKNNVDTLVNAVCGAGKTELIYGIISYCLSLGKTVAFAVPRRDVVIELFLRIREVFPANSVVSVYGQHTSKLEGDIVVLTTHQLYRYDNYFDLIILDEIDAFPFKDNKLLNAMFFRAVRGNLVMMSATPSDDVIEFFSGEKKAILELNTRFHRHPLPVPIVRKIIGYFKFIFVLKKLAEYEQENKKVFIFTPTISKCEFVAKFLKIFRKNGTFVHSKCKNRQEIISDFKNGKYEYLVTTAVLERGVTFKDLQVIIFGADDDIYDSQTLIQISGRVGRKKDAPEGEVIFLVNKTTSEIETAINTIKSKNGNLQNLL